MKKRLKKLKLKKLKFICLEVQPQISEKLKKIIFVRLEFPTLNEFDFGKIPQVNLVQGWQP